MSNHLAIATVTAALRQTLQEAVAEDDLKATVTSKRPDKDPSASTINVYLYQVTPNAAWRNADLPTRRSGGQLIQRPRVALDLHYLLTFHGKETEFEAERLLGCAVRRLHERPVLTRGLIRRIVEDKALDLTGSDLANDSELVKLTPSPLSLEELSKLWSIFFQSPYVLSMAFVGTVVLIDGTATPRPALPVRARHIEVAPFSRPTIETVVPEGDAGQPVLANSRLVIRGRRLGGQGTRVEIGGVEVTPGQVSDTAIVVDLAAADLRAGVQPVQVVHPLGASNAVPLMLRPAVAGVRFAERPRGRPRPKRELEERSRGRPRPERHRVIEVEVRPAVGKEQRSALLLRGLGGGDAPHYTLTPIKDRDEMVFPATGVKAGEYLVAIQVDGAESVFEVDTDPESKTFERYVGPRVSVPPEKKPERDDD